jgi:hypothetical protein
LFEHLEIARAALDGSELVPTGSEAPLSLMHIRALLRARRTPGCPIRRSR